MLLAAGAVVGLLGTATLLHSARLALQGRTATATVVERVAQPARRGPVYWLTLEFQADDGRMVRVRSSIASRGPQFELGARVPVLYLPGAPERADLKDGRLQWFAGGVLVGIGALVGLLGWALAGSHAEKPATADA